MLNATDMSVDVDVDGRSYATRHQNLTVSYSKKLSSYPPKAIPEKPYVQNGSLLLVPMRVKHSIVSEQKVSIEMYVFLFLSAVELCHQSWEGLC